MSGYALGSSNLQHFFLLEKQNSMNWQCILHELVCWVTEEVLSARSLVGCNKKHKFEIWYSLMLALFDGPAEK